MSAGRTASPKAAAHAAAASPMLDAPNARDGSVGIAGAAEPISAATGRYAAILMAKLLRMPAPGNPSKPGFVASQTAPVQPAMTSPLRLWRVAL